METVFGVEGTDEAKFNESAAEKYSSSASQSPKQIDDSVVYKLVRVQGDGRLVPATEDEVMEVEDLLEDDKMEIHVVEDSGKTIGCISNDGPFSGELPTEGSTGLLQSENTEVDAGKLNARLEYIEEMLQKVNQEERLLLACGSPDHSSAYLNVDSQCSDQHDKLPAIDEKLQSELPLQEIVSSSPSSLSDNHANQSVSVTKGSKFPDEPPVSVSSASAVCTTLKPLSNGEIVFLDDLSIRELHETFKATFGRETNVKDKQWLKRRIAMGLTNSCDVSTTTFIIRNNKLTNKGKEESSKSVDGTCTKEESVKNVDGTATKEESCKNVDGNSTREESCKNVHGTTKKPVVGAIDTRCRDPPISLNSRMEDHQIVTDERLENTCLDYGFGSDDLQSEQRAAKRVRKPTKRYIEELSEVESREFTVKLLSSDKNPGHGQTSPNSRVRHVRNVSSDGRALVTRMDSLGGSGVQIPYVSRVRRSRPRKNVMSLMKFHPSGTGIAAKLVKKTLGVRNSLPDNEIGNEVFKDRSPQKIPQPLVATQGKDVQCPGTDMVILESKVDPKHVDSSGDASDDNVVTVPTAKGGIRRKHHRAWTISEVMKLVEGVSRYGAGRWSEIKRLAFASYSYRTSVDLKDKWRNLLRASFAQAPPDKGMISRKQASNPPIPAPILLRVRELAEMQAQVPPYLSSSKMVDSVGRSVHETRSGYL